MCVLTATGALTAHAAETVLAPKHSVFDGPVGGEQLGLIGKPVVAANAPKLPRSSAPAWLVADADTGDVLAARNAHKQRRPASTIKLLAALAALPGLDHDTKYVATNEAASVEGSRVGLVPDQKYSLDDIMHGMFLSSGNDAAYALAELAGGQKKLVTKMNALAADLGAFDTHAETPHGLDTPGQLSSAYDLALFGRAALHDDRIARLARDRTYEFPGLNGDPFQIQNTNTLLGSLDGAIGLKNGYTTKAKHTVVGAAERGDTRLIVVVMGTDVRAEGIAEPLFEWGFKAADIGAEPVGRLVTAVDVAKARQDNVASADDENSGDDGDAPASLPAARQNNLTPSNVLSVVALAVGFMMAVLVARRARPTGRYSRPRH